MILALWDIGVRTTMNEKTTILVLTQKQENRLNIRENRDENMNTNLLDYPPLAPL